MSKSTRVEDNRNLVRFTCNNKSIMIFLLSDNDWNESAIILQVNEHFKDMRVFLYKNCYVVHTVDIWGFISYLQNFGQYYSDYYYIG